MADVEFQPHPALRPGQHYRESDLVRRREITPEKAAENRRLGRRGCRARPASPGILPISSGTLWNMVARGEFPRPVKLSANVSAWRGEDVMAWLAARRV